jgi:DNA polymerase-3 subunit gamma/tau
MAMSHIALYRAWRPQAFRDVVGQRHIMQTLQNALKEARYTHAYLFSGPRGTGKTSAAKILAKALNCEQGPGPEPCNQCAACIGITEGAVLDVVEIDAASNRGVEEIRDIREKVKYAPTAVRHKVYIIDEVHMLTTEAFNALLKTLEEPPPHAVFILATTEPGKIPATIVSRCQRFDFRRISVEDQMERLAHICREEGIEADGEALKLLALMSEGGMRDALSMLDQVIAYSGNRVTRDDVLTAMGGIAGDQFAALASALHERDISRVLDLTDQLMQEGKSADKCLESLIQYYRDLLLVKLAPDVSLLGGRILDPASLIDIANRYEQGRIFRIIETLNRFQQEMKYSPQPQLILEVALMKICAEPQAGGPAEAQVDRAPGQAAARDAGRAASGGAAAAMTSPSGMAAMQAALEEMRRKVEALERRLEIMGKVGQIGSRAGAAGATGASGSGAGMGAGAELAAAASGTALFAAPSPGSAVSAGSASAPAAPAGGPEPSTAATTAPNAAPVAPPAPAGNAGMSGGAGKPAAEKSGSSSPPSQASAPRLKEFLQAADGPETREMQANWHQVLQKLKDMNKVSLRAWLVNGEPVAATPHAVLVAFRNEIHQKTTEKPANRELIEQALREVFGRPLALMTTMQNQWKELVEGSGTGSGQQPPELELVAEDPEAAQPEEEWITKAIELFGEDLVEIQDDSSAIQDD